MLQYLIMCRSLTYAQRTARTLERQGITASVARAPQGVSGQGCAYCVKVSGRNLERALTALKNTNLGPGKVYLLSASGAVSEVTRK